MLGILSKKYQTAGARIRALREALSLTRQEFCARHGFSFSTLRALESTVLVVTAKHASKFVEAFKKEGVTCTKEWLLEGSGDFPTKSSPEDENIIISSKEPYNPKVAIENEMACFHQNNPNSLIIQIPDNAMSPLYRAKDYIGGIKVTCLTEKLPYGTPCLVIMQDDTKLARILYPGTQEGLFILGCPTSPDLKKVNFIVNVPLKEIYQIVWHRKIT